MVRVDKSGSVGVEEGELSRRGCDGEARVEGLRGEGVRLTSETVTKLGFPDLIGEVSGVRASDWAEANDGATAAA